MTRALSSACAAVLLLGVLSGPASAGNKPAIAILGLEVHDSTGNVDPGTTRAAHELTLALRSRAKAGTGPFEPVADGDKELIDEKLLNGCDSEAPVCMATIGAGLGAEVLVYGRIEKTPQGYRVKLRLLSVSAKALVTSTDELLPLAGGKEPDASALASTAKAWYGKLIAFTAGGTVTVKANIDRGTVLIDDEAKGSLSSGTLSVHKVAEGRHVLAIEAKDYQRYETPIIVKTGETVTQNATLVELVKKPPSKDPIVVEGTVAQPERSNLWKPLAYGTTALAVGAAGFSVYAITRSNNEAKLISVPGVGNANCGSKNLSDADAGHLSTACTWHDRQIVGWVVTGVAGAAALGSFFLAFVRDNERPAAGAASRGHRRHRELAITPIITPDGGGATVRLDW